MAKWLAATRRLKMLPAATAARISRQAMIARRLERRYRHAHALHTVRLPTLTALADEIVGGLRREGIRAAPLAGLAPDAADALLANAWHAAGELAGYFAAAQAQGQDFVVAPAAALHRRPDLYRFGLDERLLDIVEAYVGLPVGYDGVVLQYSPADGRAAATRAWHRDREDRAVVKLAIYLDAVGPEDGPFELLPDALATAVADEAAVIACTGPAGTMVFADTGRFLHRGRPITGRPRLALFFSYFAERPRDPWYCGRTGTSRRQLRALARGLSPRQRRAALWRRRLPLLARLVPQAPL